MTKRALDERSSGTTLRLAVGDQLELTLPETRTAGYSWWMVSSSSPVLAVEDEGFTRAAGVGGTGVLRWRLTANQAGSATLELSYGRAWEQSSPAKTFTLTIEVG